MNDLPDRLEAELAALRPHSASPELRQRIAGHQAHVNRTRLRRQWGIALASGFAAACVWAAVVLLPGLRRLVDPERTGNSSRPPLISQVEEFRPTLQAYQRALARSPEALDSRLEADAAAIPEANPALTRICAFTRSNSELRALLGDN
jgi:hypothetical protein